MLGKYLEKVELIFKLEDFKKERIKLLRVKKFRSKMLKIHITTKHAFKK